MHFEHTFSVAAPVEQVAAFHFSPTALRRLMPPLLGRIHRAEPINEGSLTEFTLWLGPLPVRWVARHVDVGPRGFTDEQVRGPFARWVHRHSFEPLDDRTTLVRDTIEAEWRRHPFWGPVGWLLWQSLPLLFAYRAWVTRRTVEVSHRSSCLPVLLSMLLGIGLMIGALLRRWERRS